MEIDGDKPADEPTRRVNDPIQEREVESYDNEGDTCQATANCQRRIRELGQAVAGRLFAHLGKLQIETIDFLRAFIAHEERHAVWRQADP